jgi:hypothetical protein
LAYSIGLPLALPALAPFPEFVCAYNKETADQEEDQAGHKKGKDDLCYFWYGFTSHPSSVFAKKRGYPHPRLGTNTP